MDLNNKILDFLDGASSLEEDKELFQKLANDPEMLSKMKKLMAMESSIQNNPEYFEPSVAASSKVFENLGFKYGSRTGFLAGVIPFFTGSKFITAATSSIITILLISSYFYLFDTELKEDNAIVSSLSEDGNISIDAQVKNNNSSMSNIVSAGEIVSEDVSSESAQTESKIITKYIEQKEYYTRDHNGELVKFNNYDDLLAYVDSNMLSGANDGNKAKENYNEASVISSSNLDQSYKRPYFANDQMSIVTEPIPSNVNFTSNTGFLANTPRALEFSLLSGMNNNNLDGLSENVVNFKISYLPIKSNRINFGIEVSRENFFQNFTQNIDEQRTIFYTQNPSLWTFGAASRLFVFESKGFWNPYVQVGGGGALSNNLNFYPGLYYRGVIGTTLSPEILPFDLNIGFQYTGLSTQQNGEFFNSNNTSIVFGVNF